MGTMWMRRGMVALALTVVALLGTAGPAHAHCDGLDGPVVKAGMAALESGDVRPALAWVLDGAEAEVRGAFDRALRVRVLGAEARELADHSFLETLVRLHREGEGEPFTGLKPAGRDLGPAIPAADRALASGSLTELETLLLEHVRHRLHERFRTVRAETGDRSTDVVAGRAYVAGYVSFLHFVEELYNLSTYQGQGHTHAATNTPHDH